MKRIIVLQTYDVEQFREKFGKFSKEEVLAEYAKVNNRLKDLSLLLDSGKLSFADWSYYTEGLFEVQDYIARYLALEYMCDNGYLIDDDLRFFDKSLIGA